jgi:hypothetical protein
MKIPCLLMKMSLGILLAGFIACEGPTGPAGPRGPAGVDAAVTVYTGILVTGDLVENSYWEIGVGTDIRNWLVTVLVRQGPDFAWFEPEWDILEFADGFTTVAIYESDEVVAGYQYRIVLAEYPD